MSEGFLSELLYIHIEGIGTFDVYALILYVSEEYFFELLCVHIKDIGTFDLHALILSVAGGFLSQ